MSQKKEWYKPKYSDSTYLVISILTGVIVDLCGFYHQTDIIDGKQVIIDTTFWNDKFQAFWQGVWNVESANHHAESNRDLHNVAVIAYISPMLLLASHHFKTKKFDSKLCCPAPTHHIRFCYPALFYHFIFSFDPGAARGGMGAEQFDRRISESFCLPALNY